MNSEGCDRLVLERIKTEVREKLLPTGAIDAFVGAATNGWKVPMRAWCFV